MCLLVGKPSLHCCGLPTNGQEQGWCASWDAPGAPGEFGYEPRVVHSAGDLHWRVSHSSLAPSLPPPNLTAGEEESPGQPGGTACLQRSGDVSTPFSLMITEVWMRQAQGTGLRSSHWGRRWKLVDFITMFPPSLPLAATRSHCPAWRAVRSGRSK